jgi:flagella basal body P-ring formation protein FlgA
MCIRAVSVLFGLLLLFATTYASAVTVTIPEQITVPLATFTLADIATITGDDADRIQILGNCRLGSSPAPGYSLTLTPDLISMRLSGYHMDLSDITWQVPSTIRLTTASQTVSGTALMEKAVTAAKQRLGDSDSEVTASAMQDVVLPAGTVDYKIDFPSGLRLSGPTTVFLATSVNNLPYKQIIVKLNIATYKNIVVTTRDLQPGEVLTDLDLALERRSVGRLSSYYTDKNKAIGLVVKHNSLLPSGTVLNQSLLSISEVIKRGNIVSIVAHSGMIEVVTTGLAQQNGGVDQYIRVQNLQSKRVLSARVVDATTVEVASNH